MTSGLIGRWKYPFPLLVDTTLSSSAPCRKNKRQMSIRPRCSCAVTLSPKRALRACSNRRMSASLQSFRANQQTSSGQMPILPSRDLSKCRTTSVLLTSPSTFCVNLLIVIRPILFVYRVTHAISRYALHDNPDMRDSAYLLQGRMCIL